MHIKFDNKLNKFIKTTFIILTSLAVIFMGISIYQTNNFINKFNNTPVSDSNDMVIIEWLADYEDDIALQEQANRDLIEVQARLEKLGVEFNGVD